MPRNRPDGYFVPMRSSVVPMLLALAGAPVVAQAQMGGYIALDDPAIPVLQFLIARGELVDPTPQVRPWRRDAIIAALVPASHDSATRSGTLALRLLRRLRDLDRTDWRILARVGASAYSSGRRDLLHAAGASGTGPRLALGGWLSAGPFAVGSRAIADARLGHDPDWPGDPRQHAETLPVRIAEGWFTASWRSWQVQYGQIDRQWGPDGAAAFAIDNREAYAEPELALSFRDGPIGAAFVVRSLRDVTDRTAVSSTRAFVAHRLGVRLSTRWHVAAWETMVISHPGGAWQRSLLAALYPDEVGRVVGAGYGDRTVILGADLSVAAQGARPGVDLQVARRHAPGGLASSSRSNARLGLSAVLFGRASDWGAWQLSYARIPTGLYAERLESGGTPLQFIERGVGLVRTVTDNDRLSARLLVPLGVGVMLAPGVALQRQGATPPAEADPGHPSRFLDGIVERRGAVTLAVQAIRGPLRIGLTAALEDVRNAGHVAGRHATRVEARLTALWSFGAAGVIH